MKECDNSKIHISSNFLLSVVYSDKNHTISIQTLAVSSCDNYGAFIRKEVNIHDFSTLKVEQNITVLVCSTRFFRRTVVVCYFDLS
jgi:hypothetical protein